MTSTLVRRTAVLGAAGALTFGAAAGVAGADGTAAHTTLSIRSAATHVTTGHSDRIRGNLRAAGSGLAGQPVTLDAAAKGAKTFTPAGSATTGSHGEVGFTVTPAATTRYRLVYAGDSTDRASSSGVVTVRVGAAAHRAPTSLSIRESRKRIAAGGTDHVRGELRTRKHPAVNRLVELQSRSGKAGSWSETAAARTGKHGVARFAVTPTGTTRYRLVFRGGSRLRPTHSGTVTARIAAPAHTSLSIRAARSTVQPGASDRISGVLLSAGKAVHGRTVTLLGRADGSGADFAPLATAKTGTRGAVGFTQTVATSEDYELSFAGGPHYAAATSGTVAVTTS